MARETWRRRLRPPKWESYPVFKVDPEGSQQLLTDYVSETHYTYRPARLPGNPQIGEIVGMRDAYKRLGWPPRCCVHGRDYEFIAPGPVWRAVDTGEIINMERRSGGDGA